MHPQPRNARCRQLLVRATSPQPRLARTCRSVSNVQAWAGSRTSDQNKDQPAMSPALLLRISAVVSFLFALGHTLGGMKLWSPMGENQVLELMRSVQFETMGVSRSYLDFHLGFGYCLSVAGFLQAVLLWQIASVAGRDSAA